MHPTATLQGATLTLSNKSCSYLHLRGQSAKLFPGSGKERYQYITRLARKAPYTRAYP